MIDGNKLGDVGFNYLGVKYSVMDCQKFVERCIADCGKKIDLAGANTWYRYIMQHGAVMTPEECVKQLGCVPKGAFLFILKHDGKEPEKYRNDGIGNADHIGICTGDRGKGAIHSSYTKDCVCESEFHGKTIKNGGWNMVGLWDQVIFDYAGGGASPSLPAEPAPLPAEIAVVGNVPAGNRQEVNLRAKPAKTARLLERVPCGDAVEVLNRADDWSKIKWRDYVGYMMTKYLVFDELEPNVLYCVTIHDLSRDEAESIVEVFGGSITEERG